MLPNEIIVENRGRFVPGQHASRATEVKRGQRLSPATEFKRGQRARNWMPVGSETIRIRDGVQRAFVKIAEPNIWRERAKLAWEKANGQRLPRGKVVHHIDRDALNDSAENLIALTRAEHAKEHLAETVAAGFSSEQSRIAAHAARRGAR